LNLPNKHLADLSLVPSIHTDHWRKVEDRPRLSPAHHYLARWGQVRFPNV
jgi:hypothetical protein